MSARTEGAVVAWSEFGSGTALGVRGSGLSFSCGGCGGDCWCEQFEVGALFFAILAAEGDELSCASGHKPVCHTRVRQSPDDFPRVPVRRKAQQITLKG